MQREYTSTYPEWLDEMVKKLKEADRECKEALRKTLANPKYVYEYQEANEKYEKIREEILSRLR